MHRVNRYAGVAIALIAALTFGCNRGPDGGGSDTDPLVFPWEGRLGTPTTENPEGWGSTAAVLIDSPYLPILDAWEFLDLHKERVTIKIADAEPGPGHYWDPPVEAHLRSVFNLGPARTSKRAESWPGFWFTTALFDLPSEAALGSPSEYPFTVFVQVFVDGVLVYEPRFEITGASGVPNPLADESIYGQGGFQESLEPQRMIRLRGKRFNPEKNSEDEKKWFYPGQDPIGAVEFDLEYITVCVSAIRPYPSTEAANATAIVGPPTPSGDHRETVHVVMVDPKGIELQFLDESHPFAQFLAGQGPMIDLAVDDVPVYHCNIGSPAAFKISNLLVTNLDGQEIVRVDGVVKVDTDSAPNSDASLRLYAVQVDET